ncbi:MAG TPA: VIT1/CCC1 transporter family protein [Candidatus Limnocylindrales bacterium]
MSSLSSLRAHWSSLLAPEGPHDTPGASIVRPVVFGASDGLVSNLALIMGVGAASNNNHTVLIAGVAGLLAGAISMAMGEFISVRSQHEILDYQIHLQRHQLREDPSSEAAILRDIYRSRGLSAREAELIVGRIMADHETAVETFVREEIGLSEQTMGSPISAGASSFFAFSMGAVVAVIPYVIATGAAAFWGSLVLAMAALFGVGAAVSTLTHRPPLLVGVRQVGLGLAAALVTYGIGSVLGRAAGI